MSRFTCVIIPYPMPGLFSYGSFLILPKTFSTSSQVFKEQLKNAKKFKSSSQQWLLRQVNDTYVKQAKVQQYRCRSAFKLLEINKSCKLFRQGQTVVDLGCAPGSWTQVAVQATKAQESGSKSLVIGLDLSPVHEIEGATLLGCMDFTKESSQQRLREVLGTRRVDVVVSDMAPSATGIKFMDHTNIVKLCYAALNFAESTSSPGGSLVMKVFDGGESQKLRSDARDLYESVRIVRPHASRKESSEFFFVCLNFKSPQNNQTPT